LLHAAHRTINAHVVVVQNDEHVVGRVAGVVETFEGQTAAHGAIADHGHYMAVHFALLQSGHGHT